MATAAGKPTVFIALSWLYPAALLAAALSRLILPSVFYLFSFFFFILRPPIALHHTPATSSLNSSPSHSQSSSPAHHQHAKLCHYSFHRLYFLLHIAASALLLLSHPLAALLVRLKVMTFTPWTQLFGLSSLTSDAADTAQLLLPDAVFLAVAVVAYVLLTRASVSAPASSPSPSSSSLPTHDGRGMSAPWLVDLEQRHSLCNLLSFFLLLFSGILYISFVALPYFLLFIAVLLHLSFQSYTYRHGHIHSTADGGAQQQQLMPDASDSFARRSSRLSTAMTSFLPAHGALLLSFFSLYLPLQLTMLFLYQLTALPVVSFQLQKTEADLLGLYAATGSTLFRATWRAYLSTVAQVVLLLLVGERRDRARMRTEVQRSRARGRAAEADEEEDEEQSVEDDDDGEEEEEEEEAEEEEHKGDSQRAQDAPAARYGDVHRDELTVSLLSEEKQHSDAVDPRPAHSKGTDVSSTPTLSSPPVSRPLAAAAAVRPGGSSHITHSRSIAVRHFLLRLSRYSGRFLCSLLLGVTIFTLPSLLSCLLLVLLVASLLTSSRLFTRLAPYYLFFLLLSSVVLYVFSIPSLFPANRVLQIIGISHTHLPFVYVLDMIAPTLAFSAYLVCYRLSLASLTEEALLIAASSGDEDMVRAAMKQQPPLLITHAKDERGRSLLHLACRYGQSALVLPLCRYLDVNAADVEGKTPLHLAFYHGYDRIVKLLLFHPLIDADRRDRYGQRALEQERSGWVRLLVAARELWDSASDLLLGNAEKLALLLLYAVATSNLDGLHAVYLLFFLLFVAFPALSERCWAVLVVYCAFSLTLLFSYSVLFPVFQPVPEQTGRWLELVGFFRADAFLSDLLLYYTVFIVVLLQWWVFDRKDGRRREQREQKEKEKERQAAGSASGAMSRVGSFPPLPPSASFPATQAPARSVYDADAEFPYSSYLPVYRASAIALACFTLIAVALSSSSSLFYLGYLLLFVLSLLALALLPRHHTALLLGFYSVSSLYSALLVALEYLFLADALPFLLPLFQREELTGGVIGFRSRDGTAVTWTLFPFVAVFVTQMLQWRAQLATLKAQRWERQQEEAEDRAAAAAEEAQARAEEEEAAFLTPIRPSRQPGSPSSPLGITVHSAGMIGRASSASTPRTATPLPGSSSTSSAVSQWTPGQSRRRRRWSLAIEEAVSQHEQEGRPSRLLVLLSFLFSSLFALLDQHAHHMLAVLMILVVTLVDAVSLASLVLVLLLLLLAPFHQAYFLFVPTLLYAPPLLLLRYLYQLPPVLSALSPHAVLLAWVGLIDYEGALLGGLYGDALLLFVAAVQQMVGMERRRRMTKAAAMQLEDEQGGDGKQAAAEAEEQQPFMQFAAKRGELGPQALQHPPKLSTAARALRQADSRDDVSEAAAAAQRDEERKDTTPGQPDSSTVSPAAGELPDAASLSRSASSPPTFPASSSSSASSAESSPPSWTLHDWRLFISSLLFDLCRRLSRFASTFLAHYCLQLALLFILLTAAYRNNLLSLLYLTVIAAYIVWGRGALQRVWRLLLLLVAVSVLWQFLVLLAFAPFLHLSPLLPSSSPMQRWLLVGSLSASWLSFDLLCYLMLCLELPYMTQRDRQLEEEQQREDDRRQRWQQLGRDKGAQESSSGHLVMHDEEEYRSWLEQEEKQAAEAEDRQPQLGPLSAAPPASSPLSPSRSDVSSSSLSRHRVMDRRAALVFPTFVFWLVLNADKLLFLFIFAASTSHLDLLSLPYLFFSLYLLFSNKLYHGDRAGLQRLYSRIHLYNFLVLALFLLYQLPALCPPESQPAWEDIVGLRKFVCDCPGAQCVAALSVNGALPPLLIFFLIDLQLLLLQSPLYSRIAAYYAAARSQSLLRSACSTLHTQQLNKARILSILSMRDSITRSFTSVFLLAAQLNPRYFEDESVWSTEKPEGWDEQVNRDLREQQKTQQEQSADQHWAEQQKQPQDMGQDATQQQERKQPVADEDEEAEGVWQHDAQRPQQLQEAEPDGTEGESAKAHEAAADAAASSLTVEHEKQQLIRQTQIRQSRRSQREDESALHYWKRRMRAWLIERIDFTLYLRVQELQAQAAAGQQPPPADSAQPAKDAPRRHRDFHQLSTLTLLYRFIVTQSQYVVFAVYFLTLLVHPSLVSVLVPLAICCYALFEFPRAPAAFFLLSFTLSFAVVTVKFLFQLPVFCVTLDHSAYAIAPSSQCAPASSYDDPSLYFQLDYLVGVTKATGSFFLFVLPELLCMLAIIWHRELCLERGVWAGQDGDTVHPEVLRLLEKYEETHQTPLSSFPSPNASAGSSPPAIPQPNLHASRRIQLFLQSVKLRLQWLFSFLPASIQAYYARLVPAQRLHGINISKPGSDLFLCLFFIELVCALLILFNWNSMAATSTTAVSSFATSLFSAQMVGVLFLQTLVIVAERMIYNFRSVMAKIALQYATACLWLTLTVFVWPQWSQSGAASNPSLAAFLLLKLLYLSCSGLQVYYGFPPVETTGRQDLTRHPGVLTVKLYQLYRAIPFVFELRTILDWMCTASSLDLDETFKLEDIYTRLYLVQCALIVRRQHKRGDSRPWDEKLLNGVLLFSLLLLIIFAPLLLFSSANPVTESNLVQTVALDFSLAGPRGEWTLFTISSLNETRELSSDAGLYSLLREERLVDSNDKPEDVQQVQLTNFSDSFWSISPPALQTLIDELFSANCSDCFTARLRFTFTRRLPVTSPSISASIAVVLPPAKRREIGEFVSTDLPRSNLTIDAIVPTLFRLPASAAPIEVTDQTNRSSLTIAVLSDQATNTRYFTAVIPASANVSVPLCPGSASAVPSGSCNVAFLSISNRVLGGVFSSFSFSIISLYSLILFTFGQFIRLLFSNLVQRIPYDDIQDADRLLSLVESIYVARWKREMRMEEVLYRRLIKIMRTAPLLIELTKRDTQAERSGDGDDDGQGEGERGEGGTAARERRQREAEKERQEAKEERRREKELREQREELDRRRQRGQPQQHPPPQEHKAAPQPDSSDLVAEEQQDAGGAAEGDHASQPAAAATTRQRHR